MRGKHLRLGLLSTVLLLAIAPIAAVATGNQGSTTTTTKGGGVESEFRLRVGEVPHPGTDLNAGVKGDVWIGALGDNQVQVQVRLEGLTPNQPHAQHLHGMLAGGNVCPGADAAGTAIENGALVAGDDFISTPDGAVVYGPIQISLTTSGDVTPGSGLAVDRFPVADAEGRLSYERTFEVSPEIYAALGNLHYVTHGIDLDESGAYDGAPSPLDPALPFEGTIPAGCGPQDRPPNGSTTTTNGGGSTTTTTGGSTTTSTDGGSSTTTAGAGGSDTTSTSIGTPAAQVTAQMETAQVAVAGIQATAPVVAQATQNTLPFTGLSAEGLGLLAAAAAAAGILLLALTQKGERSSPSRSWN